MFPRAFDTIQAHARSGSTERSSKQGCFRYVLDLIARSGNQIGQVEKEREIGTAER